MNYACQGIDFTHVWYTSLVFSKIDIELRVLHITAFLLYWSRTFCVRSQTGQNQQSSQSSLVKLLSVEAVSDRGTNHDHRSMAVVREQLRVLGHY